MLASGGLSGSLAYSGLILEDLLFKADGFQTNRPFSTIRPNQQIKSPGPD